MTPSVSEPARESDGAVAPAGVVLPSWWHQPPSGPAGSVLPAPALPPVSAVRPRLGQLRPEPFAPEPSDLGRVASGGARSGPRLVSTRHRSKGAPAAKVDDRGRREAKLSALGRDVATGLVPHTTFDAELERVVAGGIPAAVITIGLDWQAESGVGGLGDDELTLANAYRVTSVVRRGDPVASLGADGLAVLVEGIDDASLAITIARRLLSAAGGPFHLRGGLMEVVPCAGIVLTSQGSGAPCSMIMRAAVHGRHKARALGGERIELVPASAGSGADDGSRPREWPRRELERAVQAGEFVAHFQPVVAVPEADLVGFEALVRWEHAKLGLLSPNAFVGAAESTGLLVRIGTEVMRQALRQLGRWIDRLDGRPLTMAINLSPRQLTAEDLVDTVVDIVRASGLPANQVRIDVGEGSIMRGNDELRANLERLRAAGVRLSLDDFGSGGASFEALGRAPFDVVKLDRKLVAAMDEPTGAAVVHAMIQLGRSLGKVVVAEGVETARELTMLRQMGCDQAQGHLFSKPRPSWQIDELIGRWVGLTVE